MERSTINIQRIVKIAKALKQLNDRVVFVGGAVVPLLITDPAAPDVRPTKDVDIVVEVASRAKFYDLDAELRGLGFKRLRILLLCRTIMNLESIRSRDSCHSTIHQHSSRRSIRDDYASTGSDAHYHH